MLKKDLRILFLDKRNALPKDMVNVLSEKIFENFLLKFTVSENQNIHIFLPITKFNEINTFPFINFLWSKNVNVFVPKIIKNQIISVRLTPETPLIENNWGIKEPFSNQNETSTFDYIITPLLYCDQIGNRIGYGKGFYDAFFKKINSDAKKIGVNYFTPTYIVDDTSEQDIKIDYLVTPDDILSFSGTSIFTK